MYKNIVILIILFSFFFSACQSQSAVPTTEELKEELTPTYTSEPSATNPPTATSTPDNSLTKRSAEQSFADAFDVEDNNLQFDSIKWEGESLTFKGVLSNFFIEPSDPKEHSYLHYAVLQSLAKLLEKPLYKRYFYAMNEETVITIISQGKFTQGELLSETSYGTFLKIMNEEITTEVEWLRECEIFTN